MSPFIALIVTLLRPLSDPKPAAQGADPIGRSWPAPATGALASLMTEMGHPRTTRAAHSDVSFRAETVPPGHESGHRAKNVRVWGLC